MRMIKEAYASFLMPRVFFPGAALFLGYFLSAELAYVLYESPAVFPLHSGVALAGLVLIGIQFWPAVFFAALASYFYHDLTPFLSLMYTLGNAIQAITGATILRYIGFHSSLRRMRDILSLTLVALTVSAIAPAVRFVAQDLYPLMGGTVTETSFGVWWVGHMFSLLVITPFLIRWLGFPFFRRTWREVVEVSAALIIIIAIYAFLFFTTTEQINGIPFVYLIFPPLFWIALRGGSRFMTLALLLTSMIAISGTALGYATSDTVPMGELLFLTEIFLIVIATIFLIVTAVEEERRTATERLTGHINKLEEALEKIRTEDKAKTTFVATLAHELRNPLAPILSTIELLSLRGPDAKDFPTMLGTMRDRIRTMSRLLDDLLDISRITHEKLRLQKSTVEIVSVVRSSVESMSSLMQKRNLTFNVTLPQNENLQLEADPIRLEQIFVNLLHNAAKYTDVGGTIDIGAAREENMAVVTIRDTGIGIEANMLEKIFEPFLQVSDESGGLGIGLSLTKRLVELHGGTIEARSEGPGRGSEFIVRLPVSESASAVPIQLPAASSSKELPHVSHVESGRAGLRVLLVDDNQAATETLGKLLEFKGYSVRYAHNGASTLEAAHAFNPHIIMLDIGLPDMSGYEVAKKIRAESTDVGLIALTGYGQSEDKEKSQRAGFDHHLTKPVAIADLEKTLGELFETKKTMLKSRAA